MTLTYIQRLFYRGHLRLVLVEKEGAPFEDFFVDLARRTWNNDFDPIRAQGRHGDMKCDGYRRSTGTVFQCYAPMRVNETNLKNKIISDFDGAAKIWKAGMKAWTLVINDKRGLATRAQEHLYALQKANASVAISTMLPTEIERMVFALPHSEISDLLGVSVSADESRIYRIGYKEIAEAVDHLVGVTVPLAQNLGNVPSPTKVERNSLSPEVIQFLKKGHLLAKEVGDYFAATSRVTQGERVAQRFRDAYAHAKSQGLDPDAIFFELVEVGGGLSQGERQRTAALALVAHFFHTCDVFEDEAGSAQ